MSALYKDGGSATSGHLCPFFIRIIRESAQFYPDLSANSAKSFLTKSFMIALFWFELANRYFGPITSL
jgi:hypothetical protein